MVVGRLTRALDRPLDSASLAAFRILFGALLFVATLRFVAHGWVREYFIEPRLFFHYWGFAWIRPLPGVWMYGLYATLAAAALALALGLAARAAALVFALGFSYAHFCDKADYLNHYYLISLLSALLVLLPSDREYSLRVWLRPSERRLKVRAWALYLLRFQLAVVYVFGGIGKLGMDWLIHGEPLRIWLAANQELPVFGRMLVQPWAGLAFSWCGALFDLGIVPLLLWRVTRRQAFAVLVFFHVLTALLFHIGMFPWIMIVSAPLFFEPAWPRWFADREHAPSEDSSKPAIAGARVTGVGLTLAVAYALAQILLPLRSMLYPGNTLWTEEGFRFSWKVMLVEKAATLEFTVVDRLGRHYAVSPREYLTSFQARMAATQPDMILELAHWIARDYSKRLEEPVQVYADSQVSFNGRSRSPLVDPRVDLSRELDRLGAKAWILPAPADVFHH